MLFVSIVGKTLIFTGILLSCSNGDEEKKQFVLTASNPAGEEFFRENIMYGSAERSPVDIHCKFVETYVRPLWKKGSEELCTDTAKPPEHLRCSAGQGFATLSFDVLNESTSGNYTCYADGRHKDQFEESELSVFTKDERINVSDSLGPSFDVSIRVHCHPDEGVNVMSKEPDWYLNGQFIQMREDSEHLSYGPDHQSITITKPGRRDSGVYMCVFKEEKSNAIYQFRSYTDVFSLPYIYDDKKPSTNAMEGDDATLACKAYGHPVPVLSWQKKIDEEMTDIPYLDVNHHYSFSGFNNINNGTLTIQNLVFEDRAEYFCTATNKYNETSHGLMLRVKGKLAALWPFLGIVAEVVILLLVIFLYERHQKKKQSHDDESEDVAEQKQALTPNQDLRQRKG